MGWKWNWFWLGHMTSHGHVFSRHQPLIGVALKVFSSPTFWLVWSPKLSEPNPLGVVLLFFEDINNLLSAPFWFTWSPDDYEDHADTKEANIGEAGNSSETKLTTPTWATITIRRFLAQPHEPTRPLSESRHEQEEVLRLCSISALPIPDELTHRWKRRTKVKSSGWLKLQMSITFCLIKLI